MEFALVVPILLLVFAAAADLGRVFYAYVAIENAAKEGALVGSRSPLCDDSSASGCTDPNNVVWRVQNELDNNGVKALDGSSLVPTSQCIKSDGTILTGTNLINCEAGDTYVVTIDYDFRLITPILGEILGNQLSLTARATASVFNIAFDPTPGLSVQKLVRAAGATNEAEIVANCLEPEDSPDEAPGFYRSPCRNSNDNNNPLWATFESGDPITYHLRVWNSGAQTLTGVSITDNSLTDPLSWPASCAPIPATLAVNDVHSCEYTRIAPPVTGPSDEFDHVNVLRGDSSQTDPAVQSAVTVVVERPPAQLLVSVFVSTFEEGSDGDGNPSFDTAESITIGVNDIIDDEGVWYRVRVANIGGRAATDVTVTSSLGAIPFGSAGCPALPSSLAAGDTWICRYRVPATAAGTDVNVITAESPDAEPTTDDDSATTTIEACSGADRVIPNLIGLLRAEAETAWQAAGFIPTNLTTWGNPNHAVVTQSRQAYGCVAANATMTITRTVTP